jgi:hypothetical protein
MIEAKRKAFSQANRRQHELGGADRLGAVIPHDDFT